MKKKITLLAIVLCLHINAQEVLKVFNRQFSFSPYYRDGVFSKTVAYSPAYAQYLLLIGLNLSYTESFYKRYTLMGNIISGIGEYGGYNKYNGWSYDKNGKYWGAYQPTLNKPLPYINIDATCLIHLQDTLIDSKNDNIHVTRIIHGIRCGILYRHHPINDATNANAGTGSDSIPLHGEAPQTGSIADDGTKWGGAYYSSTDNTGKVMTNARYMPPSVTNIIIPAITVGYGFLKYIDSYIPKDNHEGLKIVDCPPSKSSGHRTFINYYADILLGYPTIQPYKDDQGNKHSFTPGKSKGYTNEYIGFRVGVEYNTGRRCNISTKLELARYPDLITFYNYKNQGVPYNNLCYINIRVGIGLFSASKHTITKMGELVQQ